MTTENGEMSPVRTPIHLWIVGVISLLWNFVGVFDYLATQFKLEFYLSQFTPEQIAYYQSFPAWGVAGWAFGVWGAFAGSILLLFRCRWAVCAFGVSILGMVVSTICSFGFSNGLEMMGPGSAVFMAVIWIIAFALFFYALSMRKRGVLR
ncbi:MAG: hypothetical protein V2I67_19500 [Thermoanaerobaculales bacterium]|nr:hypothetical protein [Thermoanaerobaculales bacterium]